MARALVGGRRGGLRAVIKGRPHVPAGQMGPSGAGVNRLVGCSSPGGCCAARDPRVQRGARHDPRPWAGPS